MRYSKPEHIQHLCHTQNMLLEHCTVISDQDHAFAERTHGMGKYGIYLELCPVQMLKSHILPVAAKKKKKMIRAHLTTLCHNPNCQVPPT